MKLRSTIVLSIVTLLLATFSGTGSPAPITFSNNSDPLAPTVTHTTYLALVDKSGSMASSSPSTSASLTTASTASTSSPGPTTSTSTTTLSYSPQPGDSNLKVDKVFLDMARSYLIVSNTLPVKVSAVLVGNLPDPCHLLRVVVGTTLTNTINIRVYSLFDPTISCITVLKPFSVTVPLGTFSSGQYTVMVNGLRLGSFGVGSTTLTGIVR